jgi:hypothetical protein
MNPASSRVLLSIGAALGMLIFLATFGETVWQLVELTPNRPGGGGLCGLGVAVVEASLLLGVGGLIVFLLCARSLRALRKSGG